MVNPIASKAALKPVEVPTEKSATSPVKTGESKFDKVRAQLQDEHARQVQIPPEVNKVTHEQHKVLEADLNKRLQKMDHVSADSVFKVDMKRAKERVQHLTKRVNDLPKTPAFEPFRERLTRIDNQYRATGHLVNSLTSTDPGDLMKIQVQIYQLTENLELMSKVVEQVTSGMKNILQTQL